MGETFLSMLLFTMMITPEAIISDADGTLVDTVKLIRRGQYETAKQYFSQHSIPEEEIPSYEAYEVLLNRAVGGSARSTLERTVRLLYKNSPHYLVHMDFDELHGMLKPIQDKIASEFVRAYEGLPEMLSKLGDADIKFAIFTSGTPHMVVRNFGIALPELGLTTLYTDRSKTYDAKLDIFTRVVTETYTLAAFTVVTAHDTDLHKPNPQSLLLAMQRLGVKPENSLVLGDHKVDMEAAMNAGVSLRVGITHGFDDRATLEASGATHVIDSLSELSNFLKID